MANEAEASVPFPYPVVHLYSPECWHGEQTIMLNADGKAALLAALDNGFAEAFTTDGEGFTIVVIETEDIDKYPLPYTDTDCGAAERDPSRWKVLWKAMVPIIKRSRAEREDAQALTDTAK
jgi:hypothetical protein